MTIIKILLGLLGLSLVVIVHEAGHFIAARLSGIHVEAFSIGWGKVLFARKWKGTEYRLSLFPLGGYCKMQGEQAMIQAWETHAREIESQEGDLFAAPFWKRIIVSLSGPVLNLVFAALIFFTIGFIGYRIYYYPSQIVLASEYTERSDYPADRAGLQSGDRILSVNGKDVRRFDQLQEAIALNPEEDLTMDIDRGGRNLRLSVTPEMNRESGAGYLGIYPWIEPVIRQISDDSPFLLFGAEPGDRIVEVNGRPVSHAVELSLIMEKEPVSTLTVERSGSSVKLAPGIEELTSLEGVQFVYLETRSPRWSLKTAFTEGYGETTKTLFSSVKGLALLFRGIDLQSAVSGPLRITYMTGDLAFSGFSDGIGEGFLTFFRFIALINIALFIMNLLPIPVLDGGQILLFLTEGILRRKLSPQTIYRYQLIGTIMVFALILFATMNDILFFTRN